MSLDSREIYHTRAEDYERLVAREDYQGHILAALQDIRPMRGLDVVETGAGTGRLACLLAPLARSVRAFDAAAPMLAVARRKLVRSGLRNWTLGVAGHHALPVESRSADVALSGWSLAYAALWAHSDWRAELGQALGELRRVLRPGGTLILLETQGTGVETPHPPADLKDYFAYLAAAGFQSAWIRTDYRFAGRAEAAELAAFFFGKEMIGKLLPPERVLLPECTGVWWR